MKPLILLLALFSSLTVYLFGPALQPTRRVAVAATPTPAPATTLPLPPPEIAQSFLAWTVAPDDGSVYVLDSTTALSHLAPRTLNLVAQSPPLFSPPVEPDIVDSGFYLLANETYLFVGNKALTQTLLLRRSDFGRAAQLDGAGLMALEPGHRLFMFTRRPGFNSAGLWAYGLTNLNQAPQAVMPPPDNQATPWDIYYLTSIVVDPPARQLYLGFYSYPGSHLSGHAAIKDLDTFAPLVDYLGGGINGQARVAGVSPLPAFLMKLSE